LNYKGPGDLLDEGFDMTPTGGGNYSGTTKAYGQSGIFYYSIEAWDNKNNWKRDPASGDHSIQITIDTIPPSTLQITTQSLPNGLINSFYSQDLSATGGTIPYTWSKTAGSLPTGLSLSSSGVISGTSTQGSTFTFTVNVTDSSSPSQGANKDLSIFISHTEETRDFGPFKIYLTVPPGKVDLNFVKEDELIKLNIEIGTELARSIIQYRETHGGYKSVNDIINVTQIGPKIAEKIKEKAIVNGIQIGGFFIAIKDVSYTASGNQESIETSGRIFPPLINGEPLGILDISGLKVTVEGLNIVSCSLKEIEYKSPLGKVNINMASKEELKELPGIGEELTQAIIDNRPYNTKEEIKDIPGIGPEGYENIKSIIYISGFNVFGFSIVISKIKLELAPNTTKVMMSGGISIPAFGMAKVEELWISPTGEIGIEKAEISLATFKIDGFECGGLNLGFGKDELYGGAKIKIPNVGPGIDISFRMNKEEVEGRLVLGVTLPIGATGFCLKDPRGHLKIPRGYIGLAKAYNLSILEDIKPRRYEYGIPWGYLEEGNVRIRTILKAKGIIATQEISKSDGGEVVVGLGGTFVPTPPADLAFEALVNVEVSSIGYIDGQGGLRIVGFDLAQIHIIIYVPKNPVENELVVHIEEARLNIPFDGYAKMEVKVYEDMKFILNGEGELSVYLEGNIFNYHYSIYYPLGKVNVSYQDGVLKGKVWVKIAIYIPLMGEKVLFEGDATVIINSKGIEIHKLAGILQDDSKIMTLTVIFPNSELGTKTYNWASNFIRLDKGGKVATLDNTSVNIPANVLPNDVSISITSLLPEDRVNILENANEWAKNRKIVILPESARLIRLEDEYTGSKTCQFNGEIEIAIPYQEGYLGSYTIKEEDLRLFWLNEESERWELVYNSKSMTDENVVSGKVNHCSIFGLGVQLASPNLLNVICYPNPCKGYDKITFKNLTDQCKIQIYTIARELVFEQEYNNTNGIAEWNLKNKEGKNVASGVYIYLITNDQKQKATGKIGIIK
jgi:competence ComEA-like helix-hairpin-helix protein